MQLVKLMRLLLVPLIFFVLTFGVHAQEEDEDDDEEITIESDWNATNFAPYTRGDQIFSINLGLVMPLFFSDQQIGYLDTKMGLGGMGSLGYFYFLGPHLFLGVQLSGMFAATEGKNMYFIVPIGLSVGYQFVLKRFEFPFYLMAGIAPQTHQQRSYFGFFSKAVGSAFFRFNSEWSFGLNTSLWWVPQWTKKTRSDYEGNINIHGFFWEIGLGARYHF